MYQEKQGKTKKKQQQQQQQKTKLTSTVTDEVTSPVSGGSDKLSVTGGSLIGGASSKPALSIKKSTYCHYYTSIDSTRIHAFWEGSCQRLKYLSTDRQLMITSN